MDAIISFKHANNHISYQWTHTAVDITESLSEAQIAQAASWAEEREIWFRDALFKCASAAERDAVTDALDALGWAYETHEPNLTGRQKQRIEEAQVTRLDQLPPLLQAPASTYWARIIEIDTGRDRPVRVARNWGGDTITRWAYAAQQVADLYAAGRLAAGDRVLVEFVDQNKDQPCVVDKVWGV
jgi:hypothetical protein